MISRKVLIRIICIGLFSLILGITGNHFLPRGIPVSFLLSGLSGRSSYEGWKPISADSSFIHYLENSALFMDVRPGEQFALDHLEGAESLPFYEFMSHSDRFQLPDTGSVIILYDFPPQSFKPPVMIKKLKTMGYKQVYFLRNGYSEWIKLGFPIEKGGGQ